jgi:hypothetical protein
VKFSVHPLITFEEHKEVGTFLVSRHFVKSSSLTDRDAFLSRVISKHLNEPSKFQDKQYRFAKWQKE